MEKHQKRDDSLVGKLLYQLLANSKSKKPR